MKIHIKNSEIFLIQGDITKQETDAIVNAANTTLRGGGGVDGAIHRAGGPAILEECIKIGGCKTGDAVITTAGKMKAKKVIHTVGPVWNGGKRNEDELLASCYRRSLEVADKNQISCISFPSISTGAYRFPLERAARIALETVRNYLSGTTKVQEVVFVLFDAGTYNIFEAIMKGF